MGEAVEEMTQGINALDRARDKLRKLPAEAVISTLIEHLRSDPRFADVHVREMAYQLLREHRAETTEVGLKEFLRALPERGDLARSLSSLGPNPPPTVLEAIGRKLLADLPNVSPEVIRALGSFGELSRAYLEPIEQVFVNSKAGEGLRGEAAEALIRINGIAWAFERFERIEPSKDPKGGVVVLGTLGFFGAETNGTYDTDKATRDAIRDRILRGVRNEHIEVRKAALESLFAAFGDDAVVIRSREDFEMNPQIKAALEGIATADPDPELREGCADLLVSDFVEKYVAKILRRQARETAKKDKDSGRNAPRP